MYINAVSFRERYVFLRTHAEKLPEHVIARLKILRSLIRAKKVSSETYVITTSGIVKKYLPAEHEEFIKSKNKIYGNHRRFAKI